jgi:hypothetical protein
MSFKSYCLEIVRSTDAELDEKLVEDFLFIPESKEQFPIPLEKLVDWGIDINKGGAKRRLYKGSFSKGVDFLSDLLKTTGGRPREQITLTIECFKTLCSQSQNEKGKQCLKILLAIERLWKAHMQQEFDKQKSIIEQKDKSLAEKDIALKHLDSLHQQTLAKQRRHEYRKGPCIYLALVGDGKIKIGYSGNLTERAIYYKTAWGQPKIAYANYSSAAQLLENCLKEKYKTKRPLNSEVVSGVELQDMINASKRILIELNVKFEDVEHFEEEYGHLMGREQQTSEAPNQPINPPSKFAANISLSTKICPRCKETKDRSEFGNDARRSDGASCYCKPCRSAKSKEYKTRPKMEIEEKECRRCTEVLPVDQFYADSDTSDGFQSYCKECISQAKSESKERAKGVYKCPACDATYELKDSVKRHWNAHHSDLPYDTSKVVRIL